MNDKGERKPLTPVPGAYYHNAGGGIYVCMSKPDQAGRVLMRNAASGWTFHASGIGEYENHEIDWDYSTGGHFARNEGNIDQPSIDVMTKAIETWGKQKQIDAAIEEMAGLTRALLKERRAYNTDPAAVGSHDAALANIADEMADVHIALAQLEIIFDNWNEWRKKQYEKIGRLERRIERNEEVNNGGC